MLKFILRIPNIINTIFLFNFNLCHFRDLVNFRSEQGLYFPSLKVAFYVSTSIYLLLCLYIYLSTFEYSITLLLDKYDTWRWNLSCAKAYTVKTNIISWHLMRFDEVWAIVWPGMHLNMLYNMIRPIWVWLEADLVYI